MAYEANRGMSREEERQRNDSNNANNVRNAANVAIASKNPHAMAVGGAVKVADKVTGGKSSEVAGKVITKVNERVPFGKSMQKASNRFNESGLSDNASRLASMRNKPPTKNQVAHGDNAGGEQNSSLPSSRSSNSVPTPNSGVDANGDDSSNKKKKKEKRKESFEDSEEKEEKKDSEKVGGFIFGSIVRIFLFIFIPIFLVLLIFLFLIFCVTNIFSTYEDALGISQISGEENGEIVFNASSTSQQEFFDRVNNVKLRYQAQGKSVDSLKIVSVFHVFKENGADWDYSDMSESVIEEIADSMLSGDEYSEDTFRNNLMNKLIPKYISSNISDDRKEVIADAVFDYIKNYYDLIGKEDNGDNSCSSSGSCVYDIKGFYIKGKGNVSKRMQVKDLYVRLMQCGTANGHNYGGTFGKPLDGESLVPFEKYILGVAYQEIGPDAPAEAIKAQLVAARSYILARHVDMGGWRTLKQESDGKWVIQVASCTQDQVYCDPDKGCSGTNGQWGQVHSGLGHGSFSRGPMAKSSPLRTYASQTNGEVLVNAQGYIVYSGYVQTEQNKFTSLAKKGLNYKQILLQVYNQGNRNYGARDIQRASCGGSSNEECSVSTGEYASWKQYQGSWVNVTLGNSGKSIRQIGCLVTSVSMLIAKSGVPTNISNFNPGTFVEYLNAHGGFSSGGNFIWAAATQAAPSFVYQDRISVLGMSKQQKLDTLKSLVSQKGVYVVAEVKGNTGQHWVAVDSISGDTINMMDPGSKSTDMWKEYNWNNTSTFVYYRVG